MAVKRSPIGADAKLYVANAGTTVTDLHGLGTYVDKYNPTDGELAARDNLIAAWSNWNLTCPVDVDHKGGTESADDSDRCNQDATVITKITNEITFNFKKKKDSSSLLPDWIKWLRTAWKTKGLIHVLMLDESRTVVGADGFFMIAGVTDFSETQKLNGSIEISTTLKPGGTPTDDDGIPYLNFDIVTFLD